MSSVFPSLSKGGYPNFENSKGGEPEKKFWSRGNEKGERFFKIKGGTQLCMLNLGIERNKKGDF